MRLPKTSQLGRQTLSSAAHTASLTARRWKTYCSRISLAGTFQLLIMLLFSPSITVAETVQVNPIPFTATYQVTKGIMSVGTTKRTLQDKGNGYYVFESITKPGGIAKLFTSGKVVERSYWRFQNDNLIPHEYVYTNSGDQKRNVKLEFDWDTYKVTNIINGDPWTMDIEEETLDKLIYQLAIMYDLSQGKTKLLYQVADGGKTKTYDIKIAGEERISTDLGTFDTVKVVRINNDRTTIIWCAKEFQYFPIKIEQKTKGDGAITAELVDLVGIPPRSPVKDPQPSIPAQQPTAK